MLLHHMYLFSCQNNTILHDWSVYTPQPDSARYYTGREEKVNPSPVQSRHTKKKGPGSSSGPSIFRDDSTNLGRKIACFFL